MRILGRRIGFYLVIIACIALLGFLLTIPETVDVYMGVVERGTIMHRITADGKARYLQKFVVDMPVSGVYNPHGLHAGDSVDKGLILGWYRPSVLDERMQRELIQREEAILNALRASRSRRDALLPQLVQLRRDHERFKRLYEQGVIAKTTWEQVDVRYQQAVKELESAEHTNEQLRHEQMAIHAARSGQMGNGTALLAPVSGIVLRTYVDQQRMVPGGSVLYEIGSDQAREIDVDVLSTEAALMHIGMEAWIESSRFGMIPARVVRVEPSAFTKLSALGIEEQRVKIVLSPLETLPLGDGYRVLAHIVLWKEQNVLRVPSNAVTIEGSDTVIVEVVDGKAYRRPVRIGKQSRDHTHIISGIAEGATIVLNPSASLESGSRVRSAE
jgi:HlyD family secretion protein